MLTIERAQLEHCYFLAWSFFESLRQGKNPSLWECIPAIKVEDPILHFANYLANPKHTFNYQNFHIACEAGKTIAAISWVIQGHNFKNQFLLDYQRFLVNRGLQPRMNSDDTKPSLFSGGNMITSLAARPGLAFLGATSVLIQIAKLEFQEAYERTLKFTGLADAAHEEKFLQANGFKKMPTTKRQTYGVSVCDYYCLL